MTLPFDVFNAMTEEGAFPLDSLGDYRFIRIPAVPFPVVPVFEMAGLPAPGAHETGEPSLAALASTHGTPDGHVDPARIHDLSSTRDLYKERVAGYLERMYRVRERQRRILTTLAGWLPGHPAKDSRRLGAAVAVWVELNRPLARVQFLMAVGDAGFGGGVLAENPVLVTDLSEDRSGTIAHNLTVLLSDLPPGAYSGDPMLPGPEAAGEQVLRLQSDWTRLFQEALEAERRRQLYEVLLGHAVDGTPAFSVTEPFSVAPPPVAQERDVPYPRPVRVERRADRPVRSDAKWIALGQWIANEAETTAPHASSMAQRAEAIARVLRQIKDDGPRPGYGEEWVVDFVRERDIQPETFHRKALIEVLEHHKTGGLNQAGGFGRVGTPPDR